MPIRMWLIRLDLRATDDAWFSAECCLLSKTWMGLPGRQGSGRPTFELIFVDSQSLDFRVKGRSWNPQSGCRTTWSGDIASTLCESGLNHFSFLLLQSVRECHCRTMGWWRLPFEPCFVHAKNIFFAQDHAAIRWRDKAAILSRAVVRGHSCPTILLWREISHLRGRPGCCEPVWQA